MSSNFPNGFAAGVTIRGIPLLQAHPGEVFWVSNSTVLPKGGKNGSNGNKGTRLEPFATITYALTKCTADRGDIIVLGAGHSDSLAAGGAGALTLNVAGVAIVPMNGRPTPAYQIRPLQENGIPVVFCHRGVEGIRAPLLPIPFDKVGHLAGEALARQGHRRVAYLAPTPVAASEYEQGFRKAMSAAGGDVTKRLAFGNSQRVDSVVREKAYLEILQQICQGPDRPTAIFTTYDPDAEMIYLLLERLGFRVPEDISLIGEGGPVREGAIIQKISSVIVQEEEIGREAAKLLRQMRDGERPIDDDEEIVVPLGFYEGQTLGPPPKEIRCLKTM